MAADDVHEKDEAETMPVRQIWKLLTVASYSRSEGFGVESHQSNAGLFGFDRAFSRRGSAVGPVGRLGLRGHPSSTLHLVP